jgi:hypothetical protein
LSATFISDAVDTARPQNPQQERPASDKCAPEESNESDNNTKHSDRIESDDNTKHSDREYSSAPETTNRYEFEQDEGK